MKIQIAILLGCSLATQLDAQKRADAVAGYAAPVSTPRVSAAATRIGFREEPSTAAMVVTGTLFAAGGIMAGAEVGSQMERCTPNEEFCGLAGAILGGLAGEMIMLPIGVHVVSDRASLARKEGVSALAALACMLGAGVTGGASIALMPAAQLWATIRAERRAYRAQERMASR